MVTRPSLYKGCTSFAGTLSAGADAGGTSEGSGTTVSVSAAGSSEAGSSVPESEGTAVSSCSSVSGCACLSACDATEESISVDSASDDAAAKAGKAELKIVSKHRFMAINLFTVCFFMFFSQVTNSFAERVLSAIQTHPYPARPWHRPDPNRHLYPRWCACPG